MSSLIFEIVLNIKTLSAKPNQLIVDSIETVDSTKLLVVIISDDFKWKIPLVKKLFRTVMHLTN